MTLPDPSHRSPTRAHHIDGSTIIDASPAAVWRVLSDFHNVDRWAKAVLSVVDTGTVQGGVGAARRCEIRGVGSLDEVVVEWQNERRLAYRVSQLGPISESTSRWTLTPQANGGTRVQLQLGYDMRFGPLGTGLGRTVVARVLGKRLPGVLASLKTYVEATSGDAGQQDSSLRARFQAMMAGRGADVAFERFEIAHVRSEGIRLHLDVIETDKQRPTVVFIPGTAVYGLMFGDFLAAIADRGYNVVSFDPRGHGRSNGRRGSYTISELVTDARAAIGYARERFGDPIHIAGSSQGGIAAFYTAATDETLAGAICHNAADLADPSNMELTSRPRLARVLKQVLRFGGSVAPNAGVNIKLYYDLLSRKHQKIKDLLAADPLTLKVIRLRALASLASSRLVRPIEQIKTPVLILHGANDSIFPQRYMEKLYNRLTCEKALKVYPGINHFLITRHVDIVMPDIVEWIENRRASSAALPFQANSRAL